MPTPNPLLSGPLAATDASTLRAFERRLRSEKKSPKTVQSYLEAARLLAGWLGGRVTLEEVTAADIEDFMIFLLGVHAASTAAVRFKSLQQLYGWLTTEEWIETDPMARLRPPKPTEKPVPVLSDTELKALIAACTGKEFAARRDEAIVRLFVDTGMRVSERCGIRLDDLDVAGREVVDTCPPRRPRRGRAIQKRWRGLMVSSSRAVVAWPKVELRPRVSVWIRQTAAGLCIS